MSGETLLAIMTVLFGMFALFAWTGWRLVEAEDRIKSLEARVAAMRDVLQAMAPEKFDQAERDLVRALARKP